MVLRDEVFQCDKLELLLDGAVCFSITMQITPVCGYYTTDGGDLLCLSTGWPLLFINKAVAFATINFSLVYKLEFSQNEKRNERYQ